MSVAAPVTKHEAIVRVGRVAIGTQGALYVLVGLLAVQVARGDESADPSQKGAIESVARQPFGQVLLIAVALGLASHALWRLLLAIRGEPGDDEDGKSVTKRVANLGRTALYASLTAAAISMLVKSGSSGGSGGGEREQKSTAFALSLPGGTLLVMGAGLAIIGAGLWNARRAITRSFLDKLDLTSVDEARERAVEIFGIAGYMARAFAYALVGWFLLTAGRQNDSSETKGLDGALKELASTDYGPTLLRILAFGLVLFGVFRVLDGLLRRPSEIAYA